MDRTPRKGSSADMEFFAVDEDFDILSVPALPLDLNFKGNKGCPALYRLASSATHLIVAFEVQKPPFVDKDVPSGAFHRGLWYFDCAEVWLGSTESERYLEFNLAPNGAWWAQTFSSARAVDESCPPPKCITEASLFHDQWKAMIRIPWKEIHRCLSSDQLPTGNITLITDGCPDHRVPLENLRSLVELPDPQPDFHRPEAWHPIKVKPDWIRASMFP